MKITITEIKCEKHPRYQAKRVPSGLCWACHLIYWLKKDDGAKLADGSGVIVNRRAR